LPSIEELEVVYPMFVKEKKIPYTNKVVGTEVYNSMIMAAFSIFLAIISIILLAYREKITKFQQKVILMLKK